jgi:protein lysine acetyltransferase
MAFGTADRYQGRGIGTFLLGAIGVAAAEAGITTLVGHVLEDNRPMRAVFAKVEATSRLDEPGVLRVEVEAATAAGLLDDAVRQELASAVHDVVTAASLALASPTATS